MALSRAITSADDIQHIAPQYMKDAAAGALAQGMMALYAEVPSQKYNGLALCCLTIINPESGHKTHCVHDSHGTTWRDFGSLGQLLHLLESRSQDSKLEALRVGRDALLQCKKDIRAEFTAICPDNSLWELECKIMEIVEALQMQNDAAIEAIP